MTSTGSYAKMNLEANIMFSYWANIFGMTGVALIATAFFRDADWQFGTFSGVYFIGLGAWFHGLSLPSKGEKK